MILPEKLSHLKIKTTCAVLLFTGFLTTSSFANTVKIHKNKVTGLLTWEVKDNGFSLRLIQLNPEFVRAVFQKHGLPKNEVERIAGYCVFGSILRNTSPQYTMHYRVADWRYRTKDGKEYPVKTKAQWLYEWKKVGVPFSWVLLPGVGDFNVGDWQQGFTTLKLPRNAVFDFIYKWQLGGKKYTGTIKNMSCAPEKLVQDKK